VRIGIVTEYYYPSIGGVQEHVHHFAREARRLGHTVQIVTSSMPDLSPPAPDAAGPDVLRIARSRPIFVNGSFGRVSTGPRLAGAMREALERGRFDVLHVHCPLTPVLPYLALHSATCPVVGTFHTNFHPGALFRLTRAAQQRYLDRLDAAVAVSRACIDAVSRHLEADFRVIPNGVDVETFGKGRRLARFDDGKLNVLWVGRAEPRNGLDMMLAIFSELRRSVEARLLVVGDGPLLPRYQAMVPRALAGDVVFAGKVLRERPDWYASADVYCATTTIASFGVTLLEAMAAGRPILASDIDGFREVLAHGREGELLPVADAGAWVRALCRLSREPMRAAAYGERGRRSVQRYAWPCVTSEVLGLYRSIGVAG
jgi:phosphatidyl-myo-inositol alpha-mannosyltransferase